MANLQRIFNESIGANHEVSNATLWVLSNVAVNSLQDLEALISSGILSSVVYAYNGPIRSTKQEVVSTICNIVMKLVNEDEYAKLRSLFLQYSIELMLIEVLRGDLNSPTN